ncbi:MAG: hypothetical protein ACXVZ4_13480 [Gaiellaceae bacterium]
MNGQTGVVRRGAAVAQRYLVSLYLVGVVAQFFLVGLGLFGMKAGDTVGKASSLDPHRELGWLLTEFGGAALLLATLIAWQKPLRRRVGLYVVLCLLGFPLQPLLAAGGEHHRFVGMFHPVNALLLLGLSATLTRRAWAERRVEVPAAAAVAVGESA